MVEPLIGITGRRGVGGVGWPEPLASLQTDVHVSAYAQAVRCHGGVVVQLTREADPEALVARLDGLVLAGGEDVDPRWYGSTPTPASTALDPERDQFEANLLLAAVAAGIPVLGVCRGAQVINVVFGGTLVMHLPTDVGEAHSYFGYPPHHRSHEVLIEPGTLLFRILGRSAKVNSFHHQAVDRVGAGLRVAARAADGVVEAIESTDTSVLGVQWHPELFDQADPVFGWLVEQAAARTESALVRR